MTGGVEKVCRGIGYALQHMHDSDRIRFKLLSLYDKQTDEDYVKKNNFIGYAGKRGKGMLGSIKEGLSYDTIILSHINLAPIGLAIKLASPSTRLIVWTHGIEIWRPINFVKKALLKRADDVIAVSRFTAREIERLHDTGGKSVKVIPNALDPYFKIPNLENQVHVRSEAEPAVNIIDSLKKKHAIKSGVKVFMALTRLRGTEKNKNYDRVIELLGELKREGREAYYILCGKYEEQEYARIRAVAAQADMTDNVILPGFVNDEELSAYYEMTHAFVLPSTKEGFGLAFIEAQAYGLPVLAGNLDGSTEAIRSEIAGLLIDPTNDLELKQALIIMLQKNIITEQKLKIQQQCLEHFAFPTYQHNLTTLLLAIEEAPITLTSLS